jgi:hypothetical protein
MPEKKEPGYSRLSRLEKRGVEFGFLQTDLGFNLRVKVLQDKLVGPDPGLDLPPHFDRLLIPCGSQSLGRAQKSCQKKSYYNACFHQNHRRINSFYQHTSSVRRKAPFEPEILSLGHSLHFINAGN